MAGEVKLQSWQVPPHAAKEDTKLGWINEQCEEGQSWMRSQRGYGDWRKAFDILSGRAELANIPAYRSQLTTGRLKRNVKEIIGACANIRPIWAYNSDNPAFRPQATMMNKVVRAIYLENFLDLGIKQTMQWSATTCTGWLRPVYRRNMYGHGHGNIQFFSYGQASVLPTQLPSNNDWQEAYAVTLLDEIPIAMAHGMFPDFQEQLLPTRSRFWYSADVRKASKGNMFQRIFNGWKRQSNEMLSDLYVPVRYTYIIDLTVNKTGAPIKMGEWTVDHNGKPVPAVSWAYEVPSLGTEIPVGRSKDGNLIFRKANANDAKLYPSRRLIISSEKVVMYDGPAFDWHGELPLIPFTLDDWAWEAIGLNIVRDGYNIQQATDEIDRGTMDKVRAGLDMPLGYDINSVTKKEADMLDPMQPRARVGFDGSLVNEPFKPIIPPEVLKIDPGSLQFRDVLVNTGDYQLAINDIASLAKARALGGSADNLEKVMQFDGPIVRDISRNVERGIARAGNQVKFQVLQFMTAKRVMEYVGSNGMTRSTMDYDPDSLTPSHMPDELVVTKTSDGTSFSSPGTESIFSKQDRARMFANNLRFWLLPHSVHEIAQMSYRLGLIQLRKAGVQIDSQTIAEAWNLDLGANFEGNTPWERYWEEQEATAEHSIKIKLIVDAIQSAGIEPTPAMLAALMAAGGGKGAGGAGNPEGRPPTFEKSPALVSKDNGARSTISTSGT